MIHLEALSVENLTLSGRFEFFHSIEEDSCNGKVQKDNHKAIMKGGSAFSHISGALLVKHIMLFGRFEVFYSTIERIAKMVECKKTTIKPLRKGGVPFDTFPEHL